MTYRDTAKSIHSKIYYYSSYKPIANKLCIGLLQKICIDSFYYVQVIYSKKKSFVGRGTY